MAGFSNVSTAAVQITSSTPGRRRLLSLQLGTLVQFPAGASTTPATTLRAALAADASQVSLCAHAIFTYLVRSYGDDSSWVALCRGAGLG